MTKELLLEIGVEEIPAGALPLAFKELKRLISSVLESNRIDHYELSSTGTPRRIVIQITDVEEKQPDLISEPTGPPVKAAFDKDGKPTKAATGFAKKLGLEVEQLNKIETPKGEYLSAKINIPGRDTLEVLSEILPQIITSIPWRKSMRWGDGSLTFSRPIQWILALFGGEVVPFEIEGIKSGNTTLGHRFMSPDPVEVKDFDDYLRKLKDAYVMVDHKERRSVIEKEVLKKAKELGGKPASFEDLFNEVTFLVEWPVVISATFPERYLEVPAAAIKAAMVGHQRYFPIEDENGKLLNHFITVANTPARDLDVVARGNARVLNARLADAEFFYKQDLKKTLAERVDDLQGVIFLKEIGSYYDKAKRIEQIAGRIADMTFSTHKDNNLRKHAARAALLAKADLTTEMVGEFPSLQGVMGGIYALAAGEPEKVAGAIEEHYLPRSTGDIETGILPKSLPGAFVAIADRIDTLVTCFSVGLVPKGDQDPYALRRAVLGILAIVLKHSLNLDLRSLLNTAFELLKRKYNSDIDIFLRERIKQKIMAYGIQSDTCEAVIKSSYTDFLVVFDKARALTEFRKRADFEDLSISFRRVGNILEFSPKEKKPDEDIFIHDSERELYNAFLNLKGKVAEHAKNRDYLGALELIAELRPQVDKFFDDVLVNDPNDEPRKINRHSLLYQIHKMFLEVADFSAISK